MTRFLPTSLRARLLMLLLAAVLPPLVLLGWIALGERRHAEAGARAEAQRLVRTATLRHREAIDHARQMLMALSHLEPVRARDPAQCRPLLAGLVAENPPVAALAVLDREGRVVAAAGELGPLDGQPWLRRATAFTLGTPPESLVAGQIPGLLCAQPVRDAAGRPQALVVARLRLDWLRSAGEELRRMPGGTLTVFDRRGRVLARYPGDGGSTARADPREGFVRLALAHREGTGEARGLDGVERLYAFAPLESPPERPLWVSVGVSAAEAFAPARRTFAVSLGVLALLGAGLLLMGWHALRLIVLRRIEALLAATRRLAAGEEHVRVGTSYSRSELGELTRAFDDMTAALERRSVERDRAEAALRDSEARKTAIFESAPDAIVTLDHQGTILEINAAAERLFALSRAEAVGRDLPGLVLAPELREAVRRELLTHAELGRSVLVAAPLESHITRLDGAEVPVRITFTPIAAASGPPLYSAHLRDLTDERRLTDALRAMSLVDDLTGLYNRRGFLALGRQALRGATRTRVPVLLLFADLDHLKLVNDTFGHAEGDRALQEAAQVLREVFRASDIAARVGGDEFAVLAPEASRAGATRAARRLRERIDARNRAADRRWTLEMSVGLTRWDPAHPRTIEELLAEGDALMYEQKRARYAS